MIKIKFYQFNNLGAERKLVITNALNSGVAPLTVARMIHSWGLLRKMTEVVLAKQLVMFREKVLKTKVEEHDDGTLVISAAPDKVNALVELAWLAGKQKARLEGLLEREITEKKYHMTVSTEMNLYGSILKDLMKAEFDCGEREFMGPVGGKSKTTFNVTPTANGGASIEVTTAVEEASKIMKRLPLLIEAERVGA